MNLRFHFAGTPLASTLTSSTVQCERHSFQQHIKFGSCRQRDGTAHFVCARGATNLQAKSVLVAAPCAPCNHFFFLFFFPLYGLPVDINLSGRADPGEEWGAHGHSDLVRYPPSTATRLWGFYIPALPSDSVSWAFATFSTLHDVLHTC